MSEHLPSNEWGIEQAFATLERVTQGSDAAKGAMRYLRSQITASEPAAEPASRPIPKTHIDRIHDAEQTVVGDVWTKRRKPEHFVEVLGRKPPGTLVLRHWNGRVTNKWYAYLASDYELTKRAAQPPKSGSLGDQTSHEVITPVASGSLPNTLADPPAKDSWSAIANAVANADPANYRGTSQPPSADDLIMGRGDSG
jgi:hypothetical protein